MSSFAAEIDRLRDGLLERIQMLQRHASAWKALAKMLRRVLRATMSRSASLHEAMSWEIAQRDARIEAFRKDVDLACQNAAVDGVHCDKCAGLSVARTREIERLRGQLDSFMAILEEVISIVREEVVACEHYMGFGEEKIRAYVAERLGDADD